MVFTQLRAAAAKTLLQKSYRPSSFCVEMILPIVFISGAVILWSRSTDTTYPGQTFVPNWTSPGTPSKFSDPLGNVTIEFCANLTGSAWTSSALNGVINQCSSLKAFTCVPTADPAGTANQVYASAAIHKVS